MIELDHVRYAYPNAAPIFDDYSFSVEAGQSWAVLGPSGCGKTTLLYLLAGLRYPQSGQILIHGQPLARPRPRTGLILQDYGLLPWATVRQNAGLGLEMWAFYGPDGLHAPTDSQRRDATTAVDYWLDRLGISAVAEQFPGQVSGGQRQRTAIARTLALDPDLLLMDEPFASLDISTRETLQNLILELQTERQRTAIIVTHTLEEAALLGQKILVLGQPPNRRPMVMENPHPPEPSYRDSQAFQETCRQLRQTMGDRP
jgi:NitT/TauT family transport system ATP-binding protein